jgi:hypothetical protein
MYSNPPTCLPWSSVKIKRILGCLATASPASSNKRRIFILQWLSGFLLECQVGSEVLYYSSILRKECPRTPHHHNESRWKNSCLIYPRDFTIPIITCDRSGILPLLSIEQCGSEPANRRLHMGKWGTQRVRWTSMRQVGEGTQDNRIIFKGFLSLSTWEGHSPRSRNLCSDDASGIV